MMKRNNILYGDSILKTMLQKMLALIFLLQPLAVVLGGSVNHSPRNNTIVSNLHAAYRNGQVFVTWNEATSNAQNLRVYISGSPITAGTLSRAALLTDKLEPHSANDWYEDSLECPKTKGPAHGWIIEDGGQPLDRNNGLFVHTIVQSDPSHIYLAVLGANETASVLQTGINSLQQSVAVNVEKLRPIWQLKNPVPDATGMPLALMLHAHQGRPGGEFTHLFFGDRTMGWREGLPFKFKVTVRPDIVLLEPYDRVWINRKMSVEEAKANNGTYDTQFRNIESWWYGTNTNIFDSSQVPRGTPTNYTERWLLMITDWVQKKYNTNPNQLYAFGTSMGTGVLRLVLRNPQRFASVDLLVPILDPFGEGTVGNRMHTRVGTADMLCSDGVPLAERFNTLLMVKTATTDLPPVTIRVGRTDQSVFWIEKPAFMQTMQSQKQLLFAGWDNGTHSSAMRKKYEGFRDWTDFSWYSSHFATNKSYPVFTASSLNDNPGNGNQDSGDTTGFINRGFDWKVLADSASEYKIWITAKGQSVVYPVYLTVTPRHIQRFSITGSPGLYASNADADGKVLEEKIVKNTNGLVSYEKFAVTSAAGNILIISRKKMH